MPGVAHPAIAESARKTSLAAGVQPLLPPKRVVGATPCMPLNVHAQAGMGA